MNYLISKILINQVINKYQIVLNNTINQYMFLNDNNNINYFFYCYLMLFKIKM